MGQRTVDYSESHARVPIVALDYTDRHMRKLKELMVDYTNGNLYVTDANDINVIHSLVDQISKNITNNITGDDIIVKIEGIGTINLTKFLNDINSSILKMEVEDNGSALPSLSLDNISIEGLDGKIQISDFDKAKDNYIPQKFNGRLRWVKANVGINATESPVIINGSLNLEPGGVYRSMDLPANVTVTVDNNLVSNYGKIIWNISIGNVIPTFTFPANVKFAYNTDTELTKNSIVTYELETFTGGNLWLAKSTKWLNISEREITEAYITDKLSWKTVK